MFLLNMNRSDVKMEQGLTVRACLGLVSDL
jgi:hypothetical protein